MCAADGATTMRLHATCICTNGCLRVAGCRRHISSCCHCAGRRVGLAWPATMLLQAHSHAFCSRHVTRPTRMVACMDMLAARRVAQADHVCHRIGRGDGSGQRQADRLARTRDAASSPPVASCATARCRHRYHAFAVCGTIAIPACAPRCCCALHCSYCTAPSAAKSRPPSLPTH